MRLMTWGKLFIQMTHSSVKLTVFKAELNTAVPKPHSPVLSILLADILSDLETYTLETLVIHYHHSQYLNFQSLAPR